MNQRTAQLSRAEAEVAKSTEANTQHIEPEIKPNLAKSDRTQRFFEFTAKFLLPPKQNSPNRPKK